VKALTLHQVWASAIATGAKSHETRSWAPPKSLIGERIAIHAGKSFGPGGWTFIEQWMTDALNHEDHQRWMGAAGIARPHTVVRPRQRDKVVWTPIKLAIPQGVVLCTVRIAEVLPTKAVRNGIADVDYELGDYGPNRFAWRLDELRRLPTPVPLRGAQGLFNLPRDVEAAINDQQEQQ
jgi:hypothetical protein